MTSTIFFWEDPCLPIFCIFEVKISLYPYDLDMDQFELY